MKTFWIILMLATLSVPAASGQSLDYLSTDSFYRNYKRLGSSGSTTAHLPVAIDRMVWEEFDYQDRAILLEPLIDMMNRHLDSLAWSYPVDVTELTEKGSPYVFVGSSEALTAPPGSEMMREEHERFAPMVIYLKKPSKSWRTGFEQALEGEEVDLALVIRVGFVEYPKTSKGLFEKKVILGTGYERVIRFLSADDEPVEVLQLTGVLLNRKGEVVRAGAEGIIHEDTPFWAQAFDIQKGIDDRAIASLIAGFRRDDLPGKPLAWQVALETLVSELMIPVGS